MARTRMAACAGTLAAACGVSAQLQITVDPSARHQTIDGLGVMITGEWNPEVHALLVDPAFARTIRDDLGVSIIRIMIPSYLQLQVDPYPYELDWTRFDFTTFEAQGQFAALINQDRPGAVKVMGSCWSPPFWMKTNQSVYWGGYLLTINYPHFGKYLAAACLRLEQHHGVPMWGLSFQNEPVFAEPYESCQYTYEEYRDFTVALGEALNRFGVTTRVFGPEDTGGPDPSRAMSFVYSVAGDPTALQRLDAVAIHNFPWENNTNASSPTAWATMRNQAAALGKPVWMTETAGEACTWLPGGSGEAALSLAVKMHDALVYGEVTVYSYWQITSPTQDPVDALMSLGTPTKKYYPAKQFFHYIRPGAVRVGAAGGNADVLASAFVHDQNRTLTVELINRGAAPAPVRVNLGGAGTLADVRSFETVRSTETENAATLIPTPVIAGHADLTLPAYSVVTLYSSTCYVNCDGSTLPPALNVNDLVCFINRFGAGDPWANCDGSTIAPVLNVNDFTCFLSRFGAGCS